MHHITVPVYSQSIHICVAVEIQYVVSAVSGLITNHDGVSKISLVHEELYAPSILIQTLIGQG